MRLGPSDYRRRESRAGLIDMARVGGAVEADLDLKAAEAEHVAIGEAVARYRTSSKAGAIGAPDITHNVPALLAKDLGVVPRDARIRDHDVVVERPPHRHGLAPHGDPAPVLEQEGQGSARHRSTRRLPGQRRRRLDRRTSRVAGRARVGHPSVDADPPPCDALVGGNGDLDLGNRAQSTILSERDQVARKPCFEAATVRLELREVLGVSRTRYALGTSRPSTPRLGWACIARAAAFASSIGWRA